MLDAPLCISMTPPAWAGIVLIRPASEDHRGVLLLNLAETWTRIRFLSGYLSASFFVDPDRAVIAEYVQWRSAEDVNQAFEHPAFAEHLPVNGSMAPHPKVIFGGAIKLVSNQGAGSVELRSPNYAMTVLSCGPDGVAAARDAILHAYSERIGTDIDAIAIHADAETGQVGALVAGWAASIAPPRLEGTGATIIEHLATLRRYATVPVGQEPALALRYSMAPLS